MYLLFIVGNATWTFILFRTRLIRQIGLIQVIPRFDLFAASSVNFLTGRIKATAKFRDLQQPVNLALQNSPQPGPTVFIACFLYAVPLFESYADGFSHLIVYALPKFLKGYTNYVDLREAPDLAAQLFLDVVEGFLLHDERILTKKIQVFDVKLVNFVRALRGSGENNMSFDEAEAFIEMYIFRQIESQSYMTAVSLLEQFGIRHSGDSFLSKMIEANDFSAAEKWASYMGKSMLCGICEDEYAQRCLWNYKKEQSTRGISSCLSQV
ncbi:hypothetical protein RND81_04G001900 [Saponaria officinalis]|uniref:Uncharacterized protein n=1 Tax=Saponaria officinalis TaxID=3572 RepID=A0AAW1LDZ7_SAPOF